METRRVNEQEVKVGDTILRASSPFVVADILGTSWRTIFFDADGRTLEVQRHDEVDKVVVA